MKSYLLVNTIPWAVLLLSIGLPLPKDGRILNIPSMCPYHNVTGTPCPGCGLTRSFVSLGHGQFQEAFMYHPAGPVLFFGLVIYLLLSFRPKILEHFRPYITHLGVSATMLLFAVWTVRMAGWFPWP